MPKGLGSLRVACGSRIGVSGLGNRAGCVLGLFSGQRGSTTSMTLAVFSAQATYVPMTGKRASFYLNPAKMSHWFTSPIFRPGRKVPSGHSTPRLLRTALPAATRAQSIADVHSVETQLGEDRLFGCPAPATGQRPSSPQRLVSLPCCPSEIQHPQRATATAGLAVPVYAAWAYGSAPIPLQEAGNSLYWGTAHVMCKLSLTSNIASSMCAFLVAARSRSTCRADHDTEARK
ncbi:hypothetical protein VFPBJ_06399 [Purpureocillium lilacinum]|uniref:Uncharacterized protein n=1 Tax=Purpureocillium lilacinum TaxID=33203 RepID=A0A179GLJ8_PURLI|nr:hypothetical protein VFPBJ_06399 [Purpureocillium lilacinum]